MHTGSAAVEYLARKARLDDPGESSHWREHHARFRFSGQGFEGLRGFGGSNPPPRALLRAAHSLLQRRFRRLGDALPAFDTVDACAREITERQQRAYDLDVLRHTLTIGFLKARVPESTRAARAAVIGDGFATMTALLLASGTASRVVLVNLSRTLLVDLWYLRLWLGEERFDSDAVCLVTDEMGLAAVAARATAGAAPCVVAIEAVNHELLQRCELDLAINMVSMQEMDPPVIGAYFEDLRAAAARRPLAFYCCNREEKTLPDGTVTRFADYPWSAGDTILVDEPCRWHQEYYRVIPPFYRRYDGPIRHRLTWLAPAVAATG